MCRTVLWAVSRRAAVSWAAAEGRRAPVTGAAGRHRAAQAATRTTEARSSMAGLGLMRPPTPGTPPAA